MRTQYLSLEHGQDSYRDYFVINWTFFNICNYSCSYCQPRFYDGSLKGFPLEVSLNFIDKVFENKKNKKVFFEFTGGEITYYQHFTKLFDHIKDSNGFTGIISNGSRPLAWWKENGHLIDHACLSFHAERGNKDDFYQVVAQLSKTTSVHVNIMMMPEKFEELYEFAARISSEIAGVSVAIQPLFDQFSGPIFQYNDQDKLRLERPELPFATNVLHRSQLEPKVFRGEMKQLRADGTVEIVDPTLLISRNENYWFGWKCHTGVENLVITGDGHITRGVCRVGGFIGNIQDPEFTFPSEPIVCMKKRCTCAFDIMCTKTS